jgi:hypothetical protein
VILGFDPAGKPLNHMTLQGIRYVQKITVEAGSRTVVFWGRNGAQVAKDWDALLKKYFPSDSTPVTDALAAAQIPALPVGYHAWGLTTPQGERAPFPVLKMDGFTFLAASFDDNRMSMAVFALDSNRRPIQSVELFGDRELVDIKVNSEKRTVAFTGQYDRKLLMRWSDLSLLGNGGVPDLSPRVDAIPLNRLPPVPAGLNPFCLENPDLLTSAKHFPVFRFSIYTFYPFSYDDNRNGLCIVSYDDAGKALSRWDQDGARYIHMITLDIKMRRVLFWGQDNKCITMPWDAFLL